MVPFQQECEDHSMRRGQSSTNVAMKTIYMQKRMKLDPYVMPFTKVTQIDQ